MVVALTATASPTSTVAVIVVLAFVLVAVVVAFTLLARFGGRAGRTLLTAGAGELASASAVAVVIVLIVVLVAVPITTGRWLGVLLIAGRGRHQKGQAQDKRHNQRRNAGAQKSRSLHQLQECLQVA